MSDEFNVASYPDEFTIVRVGDEFTVEQWPDEFIIHDNTDDWTIYTTTETEYTLEFQAVGLNDAAITLAARNAALAAQVQADADVVLTHADAAATAADRVQTGLDAAATAADRVQTGLDAAATAADRVQTGLDRTQTGLDAAATAADRVQTGLDRVQTGLDAAATAADRVQTGIDVANANTILADLVGGTTGQILIKASNADYDFGWTNPTGMLTAIYDPTNIAADVFARANHTGTQLAATISDFSTAADARVSAAINVTVQAYSAILAATTASYTVALDTKLGGIASGADVTVSALPVAIHGAASKGVLVDADELPLADSAAAYALKKVFWSNIKSGILAYWNGTAKAVPVDADRVWQGDSTTANTPVYSTWTQIKAFLKTYFDTLYGALAGANTWTARQINVGGGTGNNAMNVATASLGEIEVRGNGTGASMMTFHRPGAFAGYFGLDTDNVWKVGGWSHGVNAYKIWHAGNDGAGSGLDADLLDGLNAVSTAGTANTIAARDGAGDIPVRLIRTEYGVASTAGAYFMMQNVLGAGADNYCRPVAIGTVKDVILAQSASVSLSGTATGITGISADAKEVTISVRSASYNAAGELLFQLGTSAGYVASGYAGYSWAISGASSAHSTGIRTMNTATSGIAQIVVNLKLLDAASNIWSYTIFTALSNAAYLAWGNGTVALPGVLDRIQLTTIPGTPSANSGLMSLQYQ